MRSASLKYVFDPLCGWCYASARALHALSEAYRGALELMPSGLFSGEGARLMTPAWAHHAWSNDQRIEALTGQPFSAAYLQNILQSPGAHFDSGAVNRALTVIRALDPLLEPRMLRRLQTARYVEGLDTSDAAIVAAVCARELAGLDGAALAHRLEHDAELAQQTAGRVAAAQQLMHKMGLNGVPVLLVRSGDAEYVVNGQTMYGDGSELLAELARLPAARSPGEVL